MNIQIKGSAENIFYISAFSIFEGAGTAFL
jgi:hypothetical protein